MSTWLYAAANERFVRNTKVQPIKSEAELEAFFAECDELSAGEKEPDWEQHLSVINEVRNQGTSST